MDEQFCSYWEWIEWMNWNWISKASNVNFVALVAYGDSSVIIFPEDLRRIGRNVTGDVTGSDVDRKWRHGSHVDVNIFPRFWGFSGMFVNVRDHSGVLSKPLYKGWIFAHAWAEVRHFSRAFLDFGVFHQMVWVFGLVLGCYGC